MKNDKDLSVLVLEDDEGVQELFKIVLPKACGSLYVTSQPGECLNAQYDVYILDSNLGKELPSGHAIAAALRGMHKDEVYLASHSGDIVPQEYRYLYDTILEKGCGFSKLYLMLEDAKDKLSLKEKEK